MDVISLLSSISLFSHHSLSVAYEKNIWLFIEMSIYTVFGFFFIFPFLVAVLTRFFGWLHQRESIVCKQIAFVALTLLRVPLWTLKKVQWATRLQSLSQEICRAVAAPILRAGLPQRDPNSLPYTAQQSPLSTIAPISVISLSSVPDNSSPVPSTVMINFD